MFLAELRNSGVDPWSSSQGAYTSMGGAFALYSHPDPLNHDIAHTDHLDGALYLEEDATVEKYWRALDGLRTAALSSRQSMEPISSIVRDLEHE
ncbi:Scr1 family TA system antitoxin-like transcriptional regulator [Streptomyces sp. Rer75]|uniref:Scr1 family TA system antitoxin-like transcriptional regulator n=1 Tax=Streptomyces sp. Rer75 TaxID=2750011 RepID=UPI00359FF82E